MMQPTRAILTAFAAPALAVLSACVVVGGGGDQAVSQGPMEPLAIRDPLPRESYMGIQTLLLDGELVNFRVAMRGARDKADVEAYGRCAAAQYALIRGAGFAQHVRTTVAQKDDLWRGDAAYVISASLPPGVMTIDAEVTVRDCGALGIPTI